MDTGEAYLLNLSDTEIHDPTWEDAPNGSPRCAHMGVATNSFVLRDQERTMMPRSSDDELVRGIAMEWLRQPAAFRNYRPGDFITMKARHCSRDVQPLIKRPVEDDLLLLNFFCDLPN